MNTDEQLDAYRALMGDAATNRQIRLQAERCASCGGMRNDPPLGYCRLPKRHVRKPTGSAPVRDT